MWQNLLPQQQTNTFACGIHSDNFTETFISVINQLDAQNFCFTISLFHTSTCFEHMCSKHVEAWNKLIVKQKFYASSWLITEIYWYARSAKRQNLLRQFCRHLYRLVRPTDGTCVTSVNIDPLNAELNPICHLLALLAHHILHFSRMRVNPS